MGLTENPFDLMLQQSDIQIFEAPSILGLKPTGVEKLSETLLSNGLAEKIHSKNPIIQIPTLNHQYTYQRDKHTAVLNADALNEFSLSVHNAINKNLSTNKFALVLGGDCSILIGTMSALKANGTFGLFFLDAHADFYEPEKSITGEAADMDLALVTGRGPDLLTNMHFASPYVKDKHVIHIGQRDMEETRKYGSQDIRATDIKCFDLPSIKILGVRKTIDLIEEHVRDIHVDGFWIHFDTDVIADENNPAVDYRLPDGLSFEACENMLKHLINHHQIVGMSVTIFNPNLDQDRKIGLRLTECISNIFN